MTSALEGGEWSAARPGRTLPPGRTRYPLSHIIEGSEFSSLVPCLLVITGCRKLIVTALMRLPVEVETHTHAGTHTHTHTRRNWIWWEIQQSRNFTDNERTGGYDNVIVNSFTCTCVNRKWCQPTGNTKVPCLGFKYAVCRLNLEMGCAHLCIFCGVDETRFSTELLLTTQHCLKSLFCYH
jgi:hypothetical protein